MFLLIQTYIFAKIQISGTSCRREHVPRLHKRNESDSAQMNLAKPAGSADGNDSD